MPFSHFLPFSLAYITDYAVLFSVKKHPFSLITDFVVNCSQFFIFESS